MKRDNEEVDYLDRGSDVRCEDIEHLIRTYGLSSLLSGMRLYFESEAEESEERTERKLYNALAGLMDSACMDARTLEGL